MGGLFREIGWEIDPALGARAGLGTCYIIYAIMVLMIYRELRAIRLEKGITLSQMSAMTGIAQPNLSRIEGGKVDARFSTLARIARALGVKPVLSAPPVLTMTDVAARMEDGRQRLAERGIHTRNVEQRLAWKQARGTDTSVERRLLR